MNLMLGIYLRYKNGVRIDQNEEEINESKNEFQQEDPLGYNMYSFQ